MISAAVQNMGEHDSHPLASSMTVIPAQGGIHCDRRSAPQFRSDLRITYHIAYASVLGIPSLLTVGTEACCGPCPQLLPGSAVGVTGKRRVRYGKV
jgi:hypothetical protein